LHYLTYCLAKRGMRMLTRTAGVELARHNILLTGVGPGAVATPINLSTMTDPAKLAKLNAAIPLGRMAQPEEIARVAWLLAAVLTIFRHFDHSYVLKELRGGEASGYFVLDYGLFERLVYILVVGYDVFGNVSYQLFTRLYMEMQRREAEDNFLLFLPPKERVRLRGQWYQKELAKLEQKPFLDPDDYQFPTQIDFRNASQTGKELVEKLGTQYFSAAVRGSYDGAPHSEYPPLKAMAGKPARSAPFVNLFPDSSLVLIEAGGRLKKVVTVIRDRAHRALGRFVLESSARMPEEDRLAIVDGLATSYPNLFFVVSEERLPDFLRDLSQADSRDRAPAFISNWAIWKTNPNFWAVSDQLHAYLSQSDPANFGMLDYTRYGIWTEAGDWRD
jgi:Fatty acid cis/trans isomerase (CTI)/Enoyl-(Acyl carrier protein) reductase